MYTVMLYHDEFMSCAKCEKFQFWRNVLAYLTEKLAYGSEYESAEVHQEKVGCILTYSKGGLD